MITEGELKRLHLNKGGKSIRHIKSEEGPSCQKGGWFICLRKNKEIDVVVTVGNEIINYFKGFGALLVAQLVKKKISLQCRRPRFDSWVGKIQWRRDREPTPVFLVFLGDSAGKESAENVGCLSLIPGMGRSSGEGKGYPLQYSGLENSMDYTVPLTKRLTWLSNVHLFSRVLNFILS